MRKIAVVDDIPACHCHMSPHVLKTLRAMQQSQQLEYNGGLFSVHRLDRVTSGVILFAKDAEAAAMAAAAFQNRTVHKCGCNPLNGGMPS